MKFKATIISFILLVYVMELAALPVYCMPAPKKESACARQMAESPCKKTSSACEKTSTPCQKPSKKCNKEMAGCCVNCPICYVMILPAGAMPAKSPDIVKKEYSPYQSGYDFTHTATSWKPPDAC